MIRMSWTTFRDRWQLFVGAIVTVCFGVALVQSSLLALAAAADPPAPALLSESERQGYDSAAGLLGMIVALSLFIAVFIVSSTFAFTVDQRRRDLALLRLTGASRRQVRRLLLGEALVLGVLGTAAGVLVGLPLAEFEVWLLAGLGFVPEGFAAPWEFWVLPFAAGAGIGVAVLGVLGASRRAGRVRALDALRETGRAARVMTWTRWTWGLFCLAGGIALIVLAPAAGGEAALALSLLVCIVLVMAFSALSPLVVPLVGRLLGVLVGRAQLVELAHANLRDGTRRSAATAAPILVLVGLVVGIGGTLGAITAGSREEALQTLTGDLVVTADRSIDAELAAVEGVRVASAEVRVTFRVELRRPDQQPEVTAVDGVAIDPGTYQLTHRLPLEAGSLDALRGDTVAVNSGYAPDQRWRVGGTLRVHVGDAARDLRIVAVLPLRVAGPDFLLPEGFPDGVVPAEGDRRYVVRVDDGVDAAVVADRIRAAELGTASTVADFVRDDVDQQQRNSLKVMVALLGMAAAYTVIAMVNAVVIAAADRAAEFAVARLTGLTRRQVVLAALWESLGVVVVGVLLGGSAAAGTVTGVSAAVSDIVGTTVVSVPWPLFTALAAGAATVVGVTSVLTTVAATRRPAVTFAGSRE